VTPASIGIKTDDYTKYVALGFNLYAANDHQGALATFRAALRIKPISAHAPEWLVVVLNAQGYRDRLCKIDGGPWVENRAKPRGANAGPRRNGHPVAAPCRSTVVHATLALALSQS